MSYQVLARKWRPKSFSTLVGQDHVVRALTHALEQNRLHHAYLFTGTRGVGKTTIARIMAKALNCETGVSATPCGVCSACMEIDSGRYIDYIELDAASNRGVDDMTQLLERAVYAPTRGKYKVYVIDEVHQLTGHAFNAMLKTLEEPPEHVKFILATTDPQKIPVTVLSRCLQFNLKQMSPTAIVDHLARVLEAEGITFEPAALRHLAKGAAGSMRDALSLLDQAIAHGGGTVADESVRAMLGTVGDEHLFVLLDALAATDVSAMIELAKLMDARSLSFDGGLQELATLFHRIALVQFAPDALLDATERERLSVYAAAFDAEFLQLAYQIAIHGRDELSLAPDEYSGFVMTLLRLHAFAPERAVGSATKKHNLSTGAQVLPPVAARPAPVAPMQPDSGGAGVSQSIALRLQSGSAVQSRDSTPAPTGESRAMESSVQPDDEWHALVAKLPLTGMIKQLANHCELSERSEAIIRLRLSPERKSVLDKARQEALQTALQKHFGNSARLEIVIAEPASATPAQRATIAQTERQQSASAAIKRDPFVRDLIDAFGAGIDESSIKPI
ncbi:MAG: DNA polymerase III subunit gamma/tau [Rhodocyclaceae bacterium]|nr:DNA polymerase III subunit gamma/tau [Rhodocyclaceae bacterium]MBP6109213.1 DNA polymerase III subunit gamma/tau [Rhodocyclaceae bacterium]MBP6278561.1 DNA polymerase III subunit gamma/tau [Rhodocyclaceae bacterium]